MKRKQIASLVAISILVAVVLFFIPKKTNQVEEEQKPEPLELSVPQNDAINDLVNETENQEQNMKVAKTYTSPPKLQIDLSKQYTAKVTTSHGLLTINLFPDEAPNTVNNFVFLARENFYNDTIFHRIISGFMIQGGDPNGNGTGGPGYKFKDEPITRNYTRGIVAMANSGPNTNGSQFFIMTKDTNLPKQYVIFGELTGDDSFATLDTIASTPVEPSLSGENSKPTTKISIQSIEIQES